MGSHTYMIINPWTLVTKRSVKWKVIVLIKNKSIYTYPLLSYSWFIIKNNEKIYIKLKNKSYINTINKNLKIGRGRMEYIINFDVI